MHSWRAICLVKRYKRSFSLYRGSCSLFLKQESYMRDVRSFSSLEAANLSPVAASGEIKFPSIPEKGYSLHVSNLDPQVTSTLLLEIFREFGEMYTIQTPQFKNGLPGYTYIVFYEEDAAVKAILRANGKMLHGRKISVNPYNKGSLKFYSLRLCRVHKNVTEEDITAQFEIYGKIASVFIPYSSDSHEVKIAIVHYLEQVSAINALNDMNGKMFHGRRLEVHIAKEGILKNYMVKFKIVNDSSTEDQIREDIEQFGEIIGFHAYKDYLGIMRVTVHFKTEEAGFQAVIGVSEGNIFEYPIEAEIPAESDIKAYEISVQNMSISTTAYHLKEIFSMFGHIVGVRLYYTISKEERKRIFYIQFAKESAAYNAIRLMEGKNLMGKSIKVSVSPRSKMKTYRVVVNNLDWEVTSQCLAEEFGKFGEIVQTHLFTDAAGKSEGKGLVYFSTREAALDSLQHMNGRLMLKRHLRVELLCNNLK